MNFLIPSNTMIISRQKLLIGQILAGSHSGQNENLVKDIWAEDIWAAVDILARMTFGPLTFGPVDIWAKMKLGC